MSPSHSQILASFKFDPHAIHPFTNGSGLTPPAPQPSQYPISIPSPRRLSTFSQPYGDHKPPPPSSSLDSSASSNSSSSPAYAPQPRRQSTNTSLPRSSTSPTQPIFVPFRQDTSSPDLILKKKAPTTKSVSTQTLKS